MDLKIKCFGLLAEAIDKEDFAISLKENCTVQELKDTLLQTFPVLEGKEFKVAVNKTIATEKRQLLPTDELALLPPFSGG